MQRCHSQYWVEVPSPAHSQDYISGQGGSTSAITVTYENLPMLALQQRTTRLTGNGAFFCITQCSKIDEATPEEYYLGWKLHISIANDLPKAFDCIAQIVIGYGFFFKVINLANRNIDDRFKEGTQITIPLEELQYPVQSQDNVGRMMQEIEQVLQQHQIYPGKIPDSDALTFSPYFSMRNDKKPSLLAMSAIEYIPAITAGKNPNPGNCVNPFKDLLGSPGKPFDTYQHFLLFDVNKQDHRILSCFQVTLLSCLNEYTIFEIMNDQDRREFALQYCAQNGGNLNAEFLKSDYKNNPQVLLAVQQAFSLIFVHEVDSSWVKGRYYDYVNSAQLSKVYRYDDSYRQFIIMIEQHAQEQSKWCHFNHGEQKRSLMDLYFEKRNALCS